MVSWFSVFKGPPELSARPIYIFFRYDGLIGSMLALAKWAQRQSARLST
jgi:hypothetical protein